MIKNGANVIRLLKRRIGLWDNALFDELLQKAVRCGRQVKISYNKLDDEQRVRILTRLVLQGKLREATRWITDANA